MRVENYAVIDNVVVEFGAGLNLLTGETGAGKSILIDALALLLGEKAYSDVVRHGAEKATVAAVYESDDPAIAAGAGGKRNRRRGQRRSFCAATLRSTARAASFVNNQPATVAVLKALAPRLAIIHAQNQAISDV